MELNNQIVSKNVMEDIVEDRLDSLIKAMHACDCPVCRADVRAIALNNLPPKYVVSLTGALYANLNSLRMQSQTDIVSVITEAIMKVKQHPRHDLVQESGGDSPEKQS